MLRRYEISLGWVLRHSRFTVIATVLTIGLTGYLFYSIPKGFFRSKTPATSLAGRKRPRTRHSPEWWTSR